VTRHSYRIWDWMRPVSALAKRLGGTSGAEIVEFVVSLPLLMVAVVGIFDFGSAFVVRQKLSVAALQGARVASNQPTTDLSTSGGSCTAPNSICALRDVIDTTLTESRLNDCGLASAAATAGPGTLGWTFTANSGGCPGTLTLTIERGCVLGAASCAGTTAASAPSPPYPSNPYSIEATRVTLSYPYRWEFNKVISLLVPGASYPSTSQITSVGIMQNLN
jgi:TadE-like protein